jgi:hypothetical protein
VDLFSVLHIDHFRTFLGLNDALSIVAPLNARSEAAGQSIAHFQSFDANSQLSALRDAAQASAATSPRQLPQNQSTNSVGDDWLAQRASLLMDPSKKTNSMSSNDGEFWSSVAKRN